jgi:hypothetical protein
MNMAAWIESAGKAERSPMTHVISGAEVSFSAGSFSMKPVKWAAWRFMLYGAAVGLLYGLYFALNHLGANAEWDPHTFGGMVGGAVGGAATGALIAGARNFLVR